MWVNSWTPIFLFPLLCWYIPALSGGSEHRMHFIQSWRKNRRLHSGVLRNGMFCFRRRKALCATALLKLPSSPSFQPLSGLRSCERVETSSGKTLSTLIPSWKTQANHKYSSLARTCLPYLGQYSVLQDNTMPYSVCYLLIWTLRAWQNR